MGVKSASGLGYGQTWQNVFGSRVAGTTYYNTTGKPIVVSVYGGAFNLTVNSIVVGTAPSGTNCTVVAVVPIGGTYVVSSGVATWTELR